MTQFEIDAIKQSAREAFGGEAQFFLFGSRLDDAKKMAGISTCTSIPIRVLISGTKSGFFGS